MKKSDVDRILGLNESKEEKKSKAQKKLDELGWLGKALMTYQDIGLSMGTGLYKAAEGVYDAGVGIVGAGIGLFSKEAKENIGNHIAYDVVGNLLGNTPGAEMIRKNSYFNGNKVGSFVREGGEAIGGMLPSVALSFIPGAGPTIGMATTGVSAGGKSMEDALNQGAGYYQSLAYGAGVGAVEAATEKIGGFVLGGGKSLVGKALAGTKLGKFTSKGIGKVVEGYVSEGFEEVVGDYADVGLKLATGVDTDWRKNLKETNEGAFETFNLGGTVGSIFGGANVGVNAMRNSARGGIRASRADESFSYISEVSKNYGKDANKNAKYDKAIDDALTDISRELSSMDDTARKNYMEGMGAFKNAFNDDGSIKMDLRADSNDGAVSSNLRAISAVLEHAPVSADVEISEGASKAKSTIESLLKERASVVISDKIGKNNALYNPHEGIIYINNNAEFSGEEIAEFVATHEVAHITEGTIDYVKFAEELDKIASDENAPASVKEKIGDVKARAQSIRDNYQGQMEDMSLRQREYLVDTELRADLAGVLLGDDYFIGKLAERNLPLAKKIFNGLKALVRNTSSKAGGASPSPTMEGIKNPSVDRESARYLNKLVSKFGKAIDKSQGGVKISQLGREDEEQGSEVENERYSFAGKKARTSNKLSLAHAQKLLEQGVDAEQVRQETGWFKGYDGKWRFEIDDSEMDIALNGKYSRNSDIRRYAELVNKVYFEDTATEAEVEELRTLNEETLKDVSINPGFIGDMVYHPALLEAYPELKDVAVIFVKGTNVNGSYHPGFKEITLSDSIRFDKVQLKKTLIHELQHAVQDIEGFAGGSSVEYWNNVKATERADANTNIASSATLYQNTAGEIEARDSANRRNLNAEQRKNTRPDIDRTDVVFADESAVSYFSKETYDGEIASIREQIVESQEELNKMPVVFSATVPTKFKGKRQAREWAVEELKQYGYQADRQGFGVIYFSKDEIDNAMKYLDDDEEKAAIVAVFRVLKRGIQIGEHNKHKNREKHTITFGAPIEINGVRGNMGVVVNMNKNKYHVHRILMPDGSVFKFDKKIDANQELHQGVPKRSLANATRFTSNNSISENGEKINTFGKKIDDERKSISKSEKFMPGRYLRMTTAEELVEGYDADTISAEEALKKLNVLGLQTDITIDNALDTLREFIPEIREFATSEREAYRESNRKDTAQSGTSKAPSPTEGAEGEPLTEEDANKQAKQSLDYWVSNGDYTQGTVRYVQNGKVKVKLAQTANEVQLAKFINNNIMSKSYTNKDVKNIIDKILSNINIWGGDWDNSYMAKLKGEDMTSVKKQLWTALNTAPEGERMGPALDIADYIVKHGVLTEVVSVTDDVYYAQTILDVLNTYKHKIDVSHIKGDIEAKYDTDRSPFTTWALKKNATERGYTADEVALELEEYGVVLNGDRGKLINEADIFIAIHELYNKSRQVIKDAAPSRNDIIGAFDADKVHEVKQKIANEILNSYDEYGKETAFSKVEKKYRKEIEGLKRRVKDVHEENRLKNAVLYEAQKIKDSKAGKYHNSTQVQDDSLKALKAILGRIKYRSDLNRSSTRAIINELAKWYTEDNPVLQGFMVDKKTSESRGLYSPHIKALIDLFLIEDADATSGAEKPLSTTELEALNQILHHMNFVFETYGKIWRGGKWIEAKDVAKGQIAVLQKTRENETVVGKLLKQGYFNFFMDPELVCARLDGADKNGYFTTLLEDLRQADIKQRHDEMLALERYDEFEKKHKKYIKELMSEKNTVKVGNVIDHHAEGGPTADILEIPRYAALDLYMVSKTRGALETFAETGWRLRLDSGNGKLDTPQATITEAQIKGIEKQLTKEDIELIEIMEEQYNVNLRRLKYDTDMIRLGMSNVFDGYYYPINRISVNNLDSNDFFFDLERVSNSSFNNSRVKGAKQAIIVSNVLTKFKKHVNGVTRYANLSIPIENMTKLLNINIGTNDNMPQSITMLLRETKDGLEAEKYVKTLIKDVQQVNIQTDASTKAVSYLRGAYAKSTLGLNPKVLFTQASSYIAGFGELRFSSLAYGVANIGKLKGLDGELDKYCPWAAVRHYEKGTTRAMTVTDKVNKFGDFFTKGIEFMDRQIVKLEFLACQKEAQARFGLKIGTEENKIKAGELLQELGLKTQQNQLTTEKSAAMRSQSEFAKTLTMFKADSMKQVSRFLQTINAMSILKKKMDAAKRSGDTAKYSALEVEYKKAQKSFCKYSAVIIASSVYMVLLARLFNKLYRKEEEDENKVLGYFEDIFGNICGMVPIISELYAFFIDGFEVNSFMYSTINNVMDAVKGTTELVGATINGEDISSEKAMTEIRKLAYSIGALAGIPTKNVYKNTKALVDIISPTTGDRVDAWFKEPSEKSLEEKIEVGIEKGDDKAVSASLDLLYGKYDLELEDTVLRREYDRLMRLEMTKGEDDEIKYTPLEAKIPDSIKIDEGEVELLQKDKNVFKNAFKELEKSQANVVKTLPYKKLSDEERAYALRKISQYYLEDTKYTYTGEKSNFAYYAKVVGIEDMALILAYAKNLKGDAKQSRREKIKAYIKSLRLNKVQTSLALRCLGYSDKENDEMVMSYVKKCYLLTKTEREELYEKVKSKEEEENSSASTKASSTKKVQFVFN